MKKQLNTLFALSFIFLSISAHLKGQNNSVKVYSNFLYLNSSQIPEHFDFERSPFQYNGLSFAYNYESKKGRMREWELKTIINNYSEEYAIRRLDTHLRYETGKYITKNPAKKFQLLRGWAYKAYYLHESLEPLQPDDFPSERNYSGLDLSFFVHLEYHLSEKVYIDINTSFASVSVGINTYYQYNPAYPVSQRKYTHFDFDGFNKRLMRIGVGYKFERE